MGALISLLAVLGLVALSWAGAAAGGDVLFGLVLPYAALVVFLGGVVWRVLRWAKAPVPFRITTTAGQQKSLPWIPYARFDNPATGLDTAGRMAGEVLFFRSLFRNTRAGLTKEPRLVYAGDKKLWLAALVFHYAFLVIVLRHLRFFLEPVPAWVAALTQVDGFLQIGLPVLYLTDVLIVIGLAWLLWRRFGDPQVRYISQPADYFPLFLILGIVLTGIVMRYFHKTDVVAVKELATNLFAFRFAVPEGIGALAYVHLFLVCALLFVFPFSKLLHAPGVFLSPTRNLANSNRRERHVNPWDRPVAAREFEQWEKDYAEDIAQAGYKLERD